MIQSKQGFLNKPNADKIILGLSIFTFVYWIIGTSVNVYAIAIVGALFELTSIPMLCLAIVLPIFSVIVLVKKGISFKSLTVYSLLILLANLLMLVFKK